PCTSETPGRAMAATTLEDRRLDGAKLRPGLSCGDIIEPAGDPVNLPHSRSEHWTGPLDMREAERESAHAGRRGLGRAAERRGRWTGARSARAPDGPPDMREAERESARAGRRGLGASEARRARSAR